MTQSPFVHLQCPVTALAFAGSSLIAAQGQRLLLVNTQSQKATYSDSIIPEQVIHGIVSLLDFKKTTFYFVWGGRYGQLIGISRVTHPDEFRIQKYGDLFSAADWILDAGIRPTRQPAGDTWSSLAIAVVTAHNGLDILHVKLSNDVSVRLTASSLREETRTLVYCARILWVHEYYMLVASGSALGEIIVWSCELERTETGINAAGSTVITLCSYAAHDGSVFGLDMMVWRTSNDCLPWVLLCSCSDDRTVKFWNINADFKDNFQGKKSNLQTNSGQRYAIRPELQQSPAILGKVWAHASRIWQVKCVDQRRNRLDGILLLSFGEDATLQLRRVRISRSEISDLKHLETCAPHSGKNIWSYALSQANDNSLVIATGGADGAIILTKLRELNPEEGLLDAAHATSEDLTKTLFRLGDKVKTYDFITLDRLLVTTHSGKVFLGSLSRTSGTFAVNRVVNDGELGLFEDLRSYSIVASVTEIGAAFIASSQGKIYCYQPNGYLEHILAFDGKIVGLFTCMFDSAVGKTGLKSCTFANERTCLLLVATVSSQVVSLIRFTMKGDRLELQQLLQLDIEASPIVTSFATANSESYITLLLGFRDGSMRIFTPWETENLSSSSMEPLIALKCHDEAITSILAEYEPHNPRSLRVLTTGRDSHFAIHELNLLRISSSRTVHKAELPLGPFIEGAYVRERDQHLLFYGFKSTNFIIYDETEKQTIFSVDCGGAHRVWAYNHLAMDGSTSAVGNFVWTRSGQLNSTQVPESNCQIERRGAHGREIKGCAFTAFDSKISEFGTCLVATAAEDTDIRIFEYLPTLEPFPLKCVNIMKKHNTGIQRLEFSKCGRFLFSCGGSEEFYVWRLIRTGFVSLGVICQATLPPISELPDLRIMDFKIQHFRERSMEQEATKETPKFLVHMVFSDSTIRSYNYCPSTGFRLCSAGSFATSCLTLVESMCLELDTAPDNQELLSSQILLTGGTDGHLLFWRTEPSSETQDGADVTSLTSFRRLKVHQNTIKCLEKAEIRSNTSRPLGHVIVTGGDDNALAITRLVCELGTNAASGNVINFRCHSLVIPRAHAASVTGLKIFESSIDGALVTLNVVSAGNDQRIKTWRVTMDMSTSRSSSMHVDKVWTRYTSIADVADLCLTTPDACEDQIPESEVIICGVGIEILRLQDQG